MTSRHFFAGINSPNGFYSCFDQIADERKITRKIFIKGGPGTGKSSLMKQILKRADEEGYKSDVFHCSSDPSSLDGLYLPQLKIALLDSTAPHIADPQFPGLCGEYYDCAKHLKGNVLKEYHDDILHFSDHKKQAFEKAYNYLAASRKMIEDLSRMYKKNMYLHGIEIETQKLINKILPEITMPKSGKCRKIFLSAVTPDGYVDFTSDAFKNGRTFIIKGGFGTSLFIKKIMETALWRGFSTEVFYCPMFPDEKVEHLILSDINVNITTYNYYHHHSDGEVIDLDEYLSEMPSGVEDAWNCSTVLFRQAIAALSEARASHGFLESFYTPAMDFDALNYENERLINSIFS